MEKKPYEVLLERIEQADHVTPGNKEGLIDFLKHEHPGDVLFTKWDYPQIIKRGKGNRVWDVDGKEYIDCISGMSAMNLGHSDKRIADAMYDQYMNELDFWFDFPTPERIKLVNRLIEKTPGDFPKRVRLALSGSDAIENAIRIARYYTKKQHIISFYGAYHGQNSATMGLTGSGRMTSYYNPMPSQDNCIEHFPYAYCYRCPYGKEEGTCDFECVKIIDQMMSSGVTCMGAPDSGICNVAALIVEPCQSSAGYIAPPIGYLKALRKLADKYGFLLIFDEVQTGMGRTGKMWCCEHEGVAPDIICFGKALGAGIPMSGIVGRAEIFEDVNVSFICSTYAGYSMGCRVGNAVLDIIEEDHLLERCTETGEYLKQKAEELMGRHPIIGTYSARGVYFGLELVKDRQTKEPAKAETHEIVNNLRDAGLLVQLNGYYGNRISFIPPITLTKEQVDEIFAILEPEIAKTEAKI
ncbi:MAG: aspartate aminotransferase family protein [Lachnospiraceae bacterium]|nr:aspartate aminotransferase family protein [Lachnospiraceae bacterium]